MADDILSSIKVMNRLTPAPAVLVVEDDPDHAALISAALERSRSCTIDIAPSVAAAFELVKSRSYRVLLVDYALPDGYGMDLVDWVGHDCAVVVMTSHGSEDIAAEALRKGARDYVTKNALFQDVLPEVIERLLNEPPTATDQDKDERPRAQKTDSSAGRRLIPGLSEATPSNTMLTDMNDIHDALLNVLGDTRQPVSAAQGAELRRALRACQRLVETHNTQPVDVPNGPAD